MKITSIELLRLKGADLYGNPLCCIINTDEGIRGFGEFGIAYGIGQEGIIGLVKDFAPLLIGEDPMDTEKIWNKLNKGTWWGIAGGPYASTTMSGLDVALWDIKGKKLGVPIYKLLGGKTNGELRAYASQIQYGWNPANRVPLTKPEEYAQAALDAVADGYDCVKVDPIYLDMDGNGPENEFLGSLTNERIQMGYDRLKAIRDAVGQKVDIICEMHCLTDVMGAVRFGKKIEDLGIYLYEEAVSTANSDMLKIVADKVDIQMAYGERLYSRMDYRPYFEDRSIDVIQPDVCNCGGFTEAKKICDMANTYEIRVQGHAAGGPIATAAALHLETAITNFEIHEVHIRAILNYTREYGVYDIMPVNGKYEAPDRPGLGQELNEKTINEATLHVVID